jgi:hypothetical protein
MDKMMNPMVSHMAALLRLSVEVYTTDWDMSAFTARQDALWFATRALGIEAAVRDILEA